MNRHKQFEMTSKAQINKFIELKKLDDGSIYEADRTVEFNRGDDASLEAASRFGKVMFERNSRRKIVTFSIYLTEVGKDYNYIVESKSGLVFNSMELREKYRGKIETFQIIERLQNQNLTLNDWVEKEGNRDATVLEQGDKYKLQLETWWVTTRVDVALELELYDCYD
jgi:hypothetical protein